MAKGTCSFEGCERPINCKTLCNTHYMQLRRTGQTSAVTRGQPPINRFWKFANRGSNDNCWLWSGSVDWYGYPLFTVDDKTVRAHRWGYTHLYGPIPDGLQLDHLCRVRHCVNPAHLEPVTCRENLMRGNTLQRANAEKTHCKWGHEFTPGNTRIKQGKRQCRLCEARRNHAYANRRNA